MMTPDLNLPLPPGISPPAPGGSGRSVSGDVELTWLLAAVGTQGYMIIPVTDLETEFHEGIYQKAKTLYRAEDGGGVDFGNNVFPAVPDIGKIYQAPSVVGALSSVLGDDYVM